VGFAEPLGSPRALVRSYRTVSPLPVRRPEAPPSAVCSLWHFPAGRPDWPLASTLPCGVPTFLDLRRLGGDPDRHRPRPPGRLTVAPMLPQPAMALDRGGPGGATGAAWSRLGAAWPRLGAADPDGAAGIRHGNGGIAAVAAGL